MDMDFTSERSLDWRAVNDGVMGGRSSGGPAFEQGRMVFKGVINTNGGGFSSVRTPLTPGDLSGAAGLALRVKSDGRTYKVTLKSDAFYRGRAVSFQGEIPATTPGEWVDVIVPFEDLRGSIFGRPVRGASFNKDAASELGFIIADGRDGPFRFEVDAISSCKTSS